MNTAVASSGMIPSFETTISQVLDAAVARSFNTDMESDNAYRASFYKVRSNVTYNTVLPVKTFSRIGFGGGVYYSELNTGEIVGRNVDIDFNATLKNGAYFGASVDYSGETFDPYEGPEGHTYSDRTSFHAWAGTNQFEEREEGGFGTPDIGCYAKLTWYLPI